MAEPEERSLDDFFAKRDKKKKKDKGSATAGKGAARPPEGSMTALSGGPKSMKKDKAGKSEAQDSQQEKGARRTDGGAGAKQRHEDDEWKEFEHKEVDYTGLRIQSLQISNEKEDDEGDKKEEQGTDWEDAGGSGTDKTQGPWNKAAPPPPSASVTLVTETPEPAQPSGVYRPPGARLTTTTSARKPQGPPEIFSDTQFPSLQATAKHIESRRDKEMEKTFEIVKHKNRAREESAKNQELRLQLDNQYAVLGEQ